MKRKFYTFFTTKLVGVGIGLRLFISRRIIEEHGGEITCTSEVGNKDSSQNIDELVYGKKV